MIASVLAASSSCATFLGPSQQYKSVETDFEGLPLTVYSPYTLLPHLGPAGGSEDDLVLSFSEALESQERICGCYTSTLSFVVKGLATQPWGRDEHEEDIVLKLIDALSRPPPSNPPPNLHLLLQQPPPSSPYGDSINGLHLPSLLASRVAPSDDVEYVSIIGPSSSTCEVLDDTFMLPLRREAAAKIESILTLTLEGGSSCAMTLSVTTQSEVQSLMRRPYSEVREFLSKFKSTVIAVIESVLLEPHEKEFKSLCIELNIVLVEGLSEAGAEKLCIFANIKSGLDPPWSPSRDPAAKHTAEDFGRDLARRTDIGIINSVRKDPSLSSKFNRHKKSVLMDLANSNDSGINRHAIKKEKVEIEVVSYDGISCAHAEKYPEQVGGGKEDPYNSQSAFLKLVKMNREELVGSSFQTVLVKARMRCQTEDLAREVRKSVMRVNNIKTYGRMLPGRCVTEVVVSLALENRRGKGGDLYRDYCVELMGYESYVRLRDSVRADLNMLEVNFDCDQWWRDEVGTMMKLKELCADGGLCGDVWDDWFGKRSAIGRAYEVFS
ncbi:hypothetical protein TrVE_jg9727 [Triparma verrucosa]|uniref:Uncharacterized protein n=1 Tax=Triparma verrucosa TaxID=1606542 RepID=A0A9W7CC28_9STRA|nr:hypothetical protein TrVE_jg9727 [Triparma verrucosa]